MKSARYIERTQHRTGSEIDLELLKRRSWPGIATEFVRFALPTEFDFHLAPAGAFLTLLNLYRSDGETIVAELPRSHTRDLRNKITFVPRGVDLRGWSSIERPSWSMAVYFDRPSADQERAADLSDLPPILEFEDHMLRAAMMQLHAILNDPSLDTPGYAETLGTLLTFELSRFKTQTKDAQMPQGGLTARQVRVVTDYLEAHLSDKTSIASLAALIDLSRFHFIRAFKKTVGMPPHQFVVHRRVERAREMLQESRLTVLEIANQTGFNSTTHFTKSFRRITGTTPSAFRRNGQ